MTAPVTQSFGSFVVQVGNGATPEVFAAPCGFTEKSLEVKLVTGDTDIPDCDNPDAVTWTGRDPKSLSATVTGQGVASVGAAPIWRAWALSGSKHNVRVGPINALLANDGGYYEGVALLTSYKLDASYGERCKISVNLESDGVWTFVPASA